MPQIIISFLQVLIWQVWPSPDHIKLINLVKLLINKKGNASPKVRQIKFISPVA